MITLMTQAAVATLNDIYMGGMPSRTKEFNLSQHQLCTLLNKLRQAGLICLEDAERPQSISSYKPAAEPGDINLLDILEATGEHLNCNHPTSEHFYNRYGKAAQKLGVVNYMTRLYLQDIKLFDL